MKILIEFMSCTSLSQNMAQTHEHFQCRVYAIIYIFFDISLQRALQIAENENTFVTASIMQESLFYELSHPEGLIQRYQEFFGAYLLDNVSESTTNPENVRALGMEILVAFTFAQYMISNGHHAQYQRVFMDAVMNSVDLMVVMQNNVVLDSTNVRFVPRKTHHLQIPELDEEFLDEIRHDNVEWSAQTDIEHIIYSAIQNSAS